MHFIDVLQHRAFLLDVVVSFEDQSLLLGMLFSPAVGPLFLPAMGPLFACT